MTLRLYCEFYSNVTLPVHLSAPINEYLRCAVSSKFFLALHCDLKARLNPFLRRLIFFSSKYFVNQSLIGNVITIHRVLAILTVLARPYVDDKTNLDV